MATTVRPDALPALSESAARDPTGEHKTVAWDGKPVSVKGPISVSVDVQEPGQLSKTDTFEPGFMATSSGDRLSMRDRKHASSYALADMRRVDIYEERGSNTGVTLLVVSIAPILMGAGFLGISRLYARPGGDGATQGAGQMFTVLGVAFLVAGGALLVVGGAVSLASPSPPKVVRPTPRPTPALELGPGGARLRVAF